MIFLCFSVRMNLEKNETWEIINIKSGAPEDGWERVNEFFRNCRRRTISSRKHALENMLWKFENLKIGKWKLKNLETETSTI